MRMRDGAMGIVRRRVRPRLADELTGLGNRRRLREDLRAVTAAGTGEPMLLVLLTVTGFKEYDRARGHSAGDALLRELAGRLRAAVPQGGAAYRTGGVDFAVLAPATGGTGDRLVAAVVGALTDRSGESAISAWHGAVRLPAETREAGEALHIATQRLQAGKAYPPPDVTRSRVVQLP